MGAIAGRLVAIGRKEEGCREYNYSLHLDLYINL